MLALMLKTILVAVLLAISAQAQTTTTDGKTTTTTFPDGKQYTTYCAVAGDKTTCSTYDTSSEAATERYHNHRQFEKDRRQYCKEHKELKWRDCRKAFGTEYDWTLRNQ
jgi:hypothetical protein